MNQEDKKEERQVVAAGLDQGQIDRLKAKHGKLTLISIDGGEEFIFKSPDMKTISAAVAVGKDDPMAFNVIIFNNCLVAGDASAVEDVSAMLSIAPHLSALIEEKKATVKKL